MRLIFLYGWKQFFSHPLLHTSLEQISTKLHLIAEQHHKNKGWKSICHHKHFISKSLHSAIALNFDANADKNSFSCNVANNSIHSSHVISTAVQTIKNYALVTFIFCFDFADLLLTLTGRSGYDCRETNELDRSYQRRGHVSAGKHLFYFRWTFPPWPEIVAVMFVLINVETVVGSTVRCRFSSCVWLVRCYVFRHFPQHSVTTASLNNKISKISPV